MSENQANAKQHSETELLLCENIHILHPRYCPKIKGNILKNKQKNKCDYIHTINHDENRDEHEK